MALGLGKAVDLNVARWTELLIDRKPDFTERPSREQAMAQLRRVAIMNLKKIGGRGTADYCAVPIRGWRDRAYVVEEIRVIDPAIIVAWSDDDWVAGLS